MIKQKVMAARLELIPLCLIMKHLGISISLCAKHASLSRFVHCC